MDQFHNIHTLLLDRRYVLDHNQFKVNLLSDPDFPEITSIANTFGLFGIDAIVAIVPKNFYDDLSISFLSILIMDGKPEIVYTKKIKKDTTLVIFESGTRKKLKKEVFLEMWSGALLDIEENASKVTKRRVNWLKSVPYSVLFLGIIYTVIRITDIYQLSHFILSICGGWASFIALKESLGFESGKTLKLCSLVGSSSHCNQVISSKGAQVVGGISMSDLAFIYFIGSMVLAIVASYLSLGESLFWISVLPIPVLVYSVYYQSAVISSWCALCILIVLVILCQIIAGIIFLDIEGHVSLDHFVLSFLALSGIASTWILLKPYFLKFAALDNLEVAYYSLIRKPELISIMLQNAKQVDCEGLSVLTMPLLGDRDAHTSVEVVLRPSCAGCYMAYEMMRTLMDFHPKKVRFNIIFYVKPEECSYEVYNLYNQIIDLYTMGHQVTSCLDDLYLNQMSPKKWLKKWGTANADHRKIFEEHIEFLQTNGIRSSPVFIMNNVIIPYPYQVKDLVFFFPNPNDT